MHIKDNFRAEKEKKYLDFVIARLKSTKFNAEEKLRRIDELADIIFIARNNYKKNKNA